MSTHHDLTLVRLTFDLPRLYELGRDHNLPLHDLDYLFHAALKVLFGDMQPRTFAVDQVGSRTASLLIYSDHSLEVLHTQAKLQAQLPEHYRICDWTTAADKPMPTYWDVGQRLGFSVRLCPTVRKRDHELGFEPHANPEHQAELDVFLAAVKKMAPGANRLEREPIYRDWLAQRFKVQGGSSMESATMKQFQLRSMVRRTQGPNRQTRDRLIRPDAVFQGVLQVEDTDRFADALRNGISPHRSFGFGLLRLRPP